MKPSGTPIPVAPVDDVSPRSRAVIYKRVLERIEALPEPDRRLVAAHLDDGVVRKVKEAGRLAWFDWRVNAHFDQAILAGFGREGALAFWRSYGLHAATSGVFSQLVDGVVRLFGVAPGVLLRRYPDGYHFATRYQGAVTAAESSDHETAIHMEGLPPGVAAPGFVVAHQGVLYALLALCRAMGEVEVDDRFAGEGSLVFRVRWLDG